MIVSTQISIGPPTLAKQDGGGRRHIHTPPLSLAKFLVPAPSVKVLEILLKWSKNF